MTEPTFAPIILFVYNRIEHTRKTIYALQNNFLAKQTDLFIFSDNAKNSKDIKYVNEVREFISQIDGFKSVQVVLREMNLGLANSIISGVSEVFKTYDKVIVLEDDIVTSKDFLNFMNESLNFYEKSDLFSVSGYSFPYKLETNYSGFFSYRESSWGWGTWKHIWESIDWDLHTKDSFKSNRQLQKEFSRGGMDIVIMLKKQMANRIDSWAVRFGYNAFRQNKYHLLATHSKVVHIGDDGSGTHVRKSNTKTEIDFDTETRYLFDSTIEISEEIAREIKNYHKPGVLSKIRYYF